MKPWENQKASRSVDSLAARFEAARFAALVRFLGGKGRRVDMVRERGGETCLRDPHLAYIGNREGCWARVLGLPLEMLVGEDLFQGFGGCFRRVCLAWWEHYEIDDDQSREGQMRVLELLSSPVFEEI